MHLNRLFAVVAPIVLLLPLAAHAEWPKGEREKYMSQCVPAAAEQIGPAAAKAHCACGADAIKSFPASDIQALMDNKASDALKQKAFSQIAACKAENKAKN
ncbi:hypothetical protein CRX42_00160 [Pseudomonas jessenii]|jgi:hypothetical protein|uniref:Uncharacterized protein n=1 Tax=Pseudomonas jessenii TaxID=77298 RepID=A0A2W0EXR2_PSEJE|nr:MULTISPECIES: hypothetical protein [Pseudomonas]PYY72597.1 hypothetical protein CRX42_00160 [Pseudomonas jessenii]WPN32122.1 hypothetical protein QMK54_10375 [Pseudomonas sp. P5_109]